AKHDSVSASGAGMWRGEDINRDSALAYLGIPGPQPTTVTIWFEGEVWLEAGLAQRFELIAEGIAFIDLAVPGSTSYIRIATTENGLTVPVATPTTGWYPIRVGFSRSGGPIDLEFRHSDSGGTPIAWTRNRLRARASELTGTLRTVFGHQLLGGGLSPSQLPILHFEERELL